MAAARQGDTPADDHGKVRQGNQFGDDEHSPGMTIGHAKNIVNMVRCFSQPLDVHLPS
jgi:hypothetical protein